MLWLFCKISIFFLNDKEKTLLQYVRFYEQVLNITTRTLYVNSIRRDALKWHINLHSSILSHRGRLDFNLSAN